MERWPHQVYGVQRVIELAESGCRRILCTSPTGGGKSRMMFDILKWAVARHGGASLFCNRKLLIEQIGKSLAEARIPFGFRTSEKGRNMIHDIQVTSIQTEYSRVVKKKHWEPHGAGVIIIDEAHLNENKSAQAVYREYLNRGAIKIGFTATPLGMGGCYDELVIAGVMSGLRECGALVPAVHYGCTEPDMRDIKRIPVGEMITEDQERKLIMVPGIHGRVIEWYRILNPHGLPSIGFAPGVPESVGFAEAFEDAGIPAAHIDGDRIWVRGVERPSTQERRDELLEMSRTGQVRIVWNRFVLREAVDMPWLRHGVLATVFGSTQTYLQAGGRLLRACPPVNKREVTVQDHGGNWWRYGSLNSDRRWRLGDTNRTVGQEHAAAMTGEVGPDGERPPAEPQPFLCNACRGVMVLRVLVDRENLEARCPHCGAVMSLRRRSRTVIQSDGELFEHAGPVFRPRQVERRHDTARLWEQYYWRYRNAKKPMTFAQAAGMFLREQGYSPPRDLPFMPKKDGDWFRHIKRVTYQELHPKKDGGDNKQGGVR
jgi:superfamily II DNA or RNA helicase